jgi:hypothetical protein
MTGTRWRIDAASDPDLASLFALNSQPDAPFHVVPGISDDWFAEAAKILGVPVNCDEFRQLIMHLQSWFLFQTDRTVLHSTGRRKEVMKQLRQIQKTADKLLRLLGLRGKPTWAVDGALLELSEPLKTNRIGFFGRPRLEPFAEVLQRIEREAPRLVTRLTRERGDKTQEALAILLQGLAVVYHWATGRKPTRNYDGYYTDAPRGEGFLQFVEHVYALLGKPYSEKSREAVDGDLKRYVKKAAAKETSLVMAILANGIDESSISRLMWTLSTKPRGVGSRPDWQKA